MTPEDILEVFAPFSDPAVAPEVSTAGEEIRVSLMRDGETFCCYVNVHTDAVRIPEGGKEKTLTLNSLLASDRFADLRGLVRNQERVLAGGHATADFLKFTLRLPDGRIAGESELDALLVPVPEKLRIVLLQGPAGMGKTTLLKRVAHRRAEGYTKSAHPPILHVTSRGRRLSRLDDAISNTNERLRAAFTFEQVPVLVRRSLIVVAIDGFDELVDADGYGSAWAALRALVDRLGTGVCILSGRDTFFATEPFERHLQATAKIDLARVDLMAPSRSAAVDWLEGEGWSRNDAEEVLPEAPNALALRPVFLQAIEQVGIKDARSQGLRASLIEAFVKREIEGGKIPGAASGAQARALEQFFEEVALDMCARESDEIDLETLRFYADVSFSDVLEPDELKALKHRVGTVGLLEHREHTLRAFPHSEVRHYFLAGGLVRLLAAPTIPHQLRRAILGVEFLDVFAERIGNLEAAQKPRLSAALECLRGALARDHGSDRLAENGGAMLLAALDIDLPESLRTLEDLAVTEAVMNGAAKNSRIARSYLRRVEARGANLEAIEFDRVRIDVLVVDEGTTFGASLPEVGTLILDEDTASPASYNGDAVAEWLRKHQVRAAPAGENANADPGRLPLVALFDRVWHKARRQSYFKPGSDDSAGRLLRDPLWDDLRQLLEQHGRLNVVEGKATAGTSSTMLHVTIPRGVSLETDPMRPIVIAAARGDAAE